MITIEQLRQVNPAAATAVADLRTVADGYDATSRQNQASEALVRSLVIKYEKLLKPHSEVKADRDKYRHNLNEVLWQVSSTNGLTHAQAHATLTCLTEAAAGVILFAIAEAKGQQKFELEHGLTPEAEQPQQEATPMEHTEARVLDWFKMNSPGGVVHSFTVREGGTDEMANAVVTVALTLEKRLAAKGWTPYGKAPSAPAPQPRQTQQAPQQQGQEGWCPIHQVQMTQRTNANGSWWSHKAGDAWCNGK